MQIIAEKVEISTEQQKGFENLKFLVDMMYS